MANHRQNYEHMQFDYINSIGKLRGVSMYHDYLLARVKADNMALT